MFCQNCGSRNDAELSFCRRCGTALNALPLAPAGQQLPSRSDAGGSLTGAKSKDPDELTGNGIGSGIVGDGFFFVAVLLSATHGPYSSLLWLFLLIPAFYCFGKGAADILHARQIRRQRKQNELRDAPTVAALPPRAAVVDIFDKALSGEFAAAPSVTERTTRDLI